MNFLTLNTSGNEQEVCTTHFLYFFIDISESRDGDRLVTFPISQEIFDVLYLSGMQYHICQVVFGANECNFCCSKGSVNFNEKMTWYSALLYSVDLFACKQ